MLTGITPATAPILSTGNHNSLLRVQPIFRLIEDFRRMGLQHLRRDLLTAVGRQAVLHHAAFVRSSQQLLIHLINPRKSGAALLCLALLAHGGPHVGIDVVRAVDGELGIVGQEDLRAGLERKGEELLIGS